MFWLLFTSPVASVLEKLRFIHFLHFQQRILIHDFWIFVFKVIKKCSLSRFYLIDYTKCNYLRIKSKNKINNQLVNWKFGRSHNNRLWFRSMQNTARWLFFEIVISFFFSSPPLSEQADAKYCWVASLLR